MYLRYTPPAGQKLLMVAVGALCAGSIVPTYHKQRNYLTKGSEVGYFAFGGSTVALIAPLEHYSCVLTYLYKVKKDTKPQLTWDNR